MANHHHKYKLIDQGHNKCLAAVLQMILERRGLNILTQDEILSNFDPVYNEITKETTYGIKDLNTQFFNKYGYNLHEYYHNFKKIDMHDELRNYSFGSIINGNKDSDIIIFANYTRIKYNLKNIKNKFNENDKRLHVMHCFLVDYNPNSEIYPNYVKLICPEETEKGGTFVFNTSPDDIYRAMKYQPHKNGLGFSIIK
jgi:hypothetical protein